MKCAKDVLIIDNFGNDKLYIRTFMLLTITLTFGDIRKHMIVVNLNFIELFQKSRGDGLLKYFMKKDYTFRLDLVDMVLEHKELKDSTTIHQENKKTFPKNIAKFPAPQASELVGAHISRFKIN